MVNVHIAMELVQELFWIVVHVKDQVFVQLVLEVMAVNIAMGRDIDS